MLKHLAIFVALTAFSTAPVAAQQQEAMVQRLGVKGADFDIVLAIPKASSPQTYDLSESPEALIVHLVGGKLALGFEDPETMLSTLEFLRSPACAFQVETQDGTPPKPAAVYLVRSGVSLVSTKE